MHMRMVPQRLAPRMEHGEADLGPEMPGISGDGPSRLGGRPKEEAIDDGLVVRGDLGDRPGQREDDVDVLDVEQVRLARLDPRRAGERLALVAVPIATGVIPDAPMATVVTLLDVPAQRRSPAAFNRGHDAALRRRQGGPRLCSIGIAVAAEHVRHGGRRPRHRQPSVGR